MVGALADAIERLLERLDAARDRDEPVVKDENYYDTNLGDGVRLYASLFDPLCPVYASIVTSPTGSSRPSTEPTRSTTPS